MTSICDLCELIIVDPCCFQYLHLSTLQDSPVEPTKTKCWDSSQGCESQGLGEDRLKNSSNPWYPETHKQTHHEPHAIGGLQVNVYMYLHHIYVYFEQVNIWGCRSIRTLQKYMLILQECIHSDKNGNTCLYKSHELIEPFWMLQASSPQHLLTGVWAAHFWDFKHMSRTAPTYPNGHWCAKRWSCWHTAASLRPRSPGDPRRSLVQLSDWENIRISRKFWVNIQHVWIEKHPLKRYSI